MEACEVLVIGAGPAGCALACALRLQGVSVRLVDQASGPAQTSRANILHARGVEVLDRLGALGTLPEQARTALTITQYLDGRPAIHIRFGDVGLNGARPALYVSQATIEQQLRSRLRDLQVAVEWNSGLVAFEQDGEGVTASLSGGRTIRCRWLAGCDGSHSTVRKLMGVAFPGVPVTERFLLADVHADWALSREGGHGWPHEDGPLFAMPMPEAHGADDLWRIMAYDPSDQGELDDHAVIKRLEKITPERTGTEVRIKDAVWTSLFRVHRRLAESYRQRRVFLVGDAAHIHSPLGGQGMVTGVGDAENLAWKLALAISGHAREALLDTYEAERRPIATEVLRGTTAATRLQVGKGALMRFLRSRVLVPIASMPSVQARMSQVASQLWVTYRDGPLARRGGAAPRQGDRIADAPCARADGVQTRLHAELGGQWLLLSSGRTDRLLAVAREKLGDRVAVFTPQDTLRDSWLIRPDAHLAWRGNNAAALRRWLDSALQRGAVHRR